MGRARRSAFSVVLVLLAVAGLTLVAASGSAGVVRAAAAGWPTSTLLVSEVVTGGTSASDEFVELVNAGAATVDLAGLEIVYVTSTGSTVTAKASWTAARPLEPGQHLLIANAAGVYASLADATYAGGFASTGGAVALRVVGGSTVDAIGWGDATNAFVEGTPAPAPPARSSLERGPGGAAGNSTDTNDNALDWSLQATPTPQNLAAPPMPVATPSPSIAPTPTSVPTTTPLPSTSPSPSPSPSLTPEVCPSTAPSSLAPSPSASPTPSIEPTPSPSPTDGAVAIVDVRGMPIGVTVRVRGVVAAEAGRLGSAVLLAIVDETAGIVVHLPAGAAAPVRGTVLEVEGKLAAPYGQLEIRPATGGILETGVEPEPDPLPVLSTELGEAVEGGLVSVEVVIDKSAHRETNGGLTLDTLDATTGGRLTIKADRSSGIATVDLPRNAHVRLVGVVGQRATHTGRLDGYRIWLRDRADIVVTDAGGSPSPSPSGSATAAPSVPSMSIAQALLSQGKTVRVVGTVTVAGKLLDSAGRVVVIQDATAAIAVRLPTGVATPRVGVRLRVDGSVGRAYGAPRIAATTSVTLGSGASVLPLAIHALPGTAYEWRLVRLEGVVADVHRTGDRWRADVAIGSIHVPVTGLPDAGLPATALVEGRRATIIGIVRRPYPTATDRRFAVVPRSVADVRLGAVADPGGAGGPATGSGSGTTGGAGTTGGGGTMAAPSGPPDIDIATLGEHDGQMVRVGGIVTAVEPGAFLLDDGTAIGRIALGGDATTLLELLAPGDALDATGRVGGTSAAPEIEVTRASDIVRVGDPGPGASLAAGDDESGGPDGRHVVGEGRSIALDPADSSPTAALLIVVAACIVLGTLLGSVFLVRRRRARQEGASRVAVRLAAISGGR